MTTTSDNEVVGTIREWLRPYQLDMLTDGSRYRIILKGRQIGVSDGVIALECVLVASGLVDLVDWVDTSSNNCVVVSRRDSEAKDVIEKCKEWVRRLRLVEAFRPYLDADKWSASEVKFVETGFRIVAETQNPDAARGKTGHLYLDEYAFYAYQREIFRSAAASTESRPDLRITIVSTPNGQGDHFHEIWTDHQFYGDWSRHKIDIHKAVEQGMPVDVDSIRSKYTADQFAQEFECSFLGGETRYFPNDLVRRCISPRIDYDAEVIFGIDAASTVDLTAVQVWLRKDGELQMGHTFVLPHIAYRGDFGRLGQVDIIEALAKYYKPSAMLVDRTGDAAHAWTRGAGLCELLQDRMNGLPKNQGARVIPVVISKKWKDTWVQKLKVAMQTSKVTLSAERKDHVFSKRAITYNPADYERIVGDGFEVSPFPVLTSDFGKVRRKWLGSNNTTFDTERDDTGHGDAFWAAVIGYSGLDVVTQDNDLTRRLMDAASSTGGMTAGSDYADYL